MSACPYVSTQLPAYQDRLNDPPKKTAVFYHQQSFKDQQQWLTNDGLLLHICLSEPNRIFGKLRRRIYVPPAKYFLAKRISLFEIKELSCYAMIWKNHSKSDWLLNKIFFYLRFLLHCFPSSHFFGKVKEQYFKYSHKYYKTDTYFCTTIWNCRVFFKRVTALFEHVIKHSPPPHPVSH